MVAEIAQPRAECVERGLRIGLRITGQVPDPYRLGRRLPLGSIGRENEARGQNDREPDPPHGHLGEGRLAGV